MRYLSGETKAAVQAVIDAHLAELRAIPGFVAAEPGFAVIDGRVLREPAVLVFVVDKRPPDGVLPEDRAPRQLGPWRVTVMQADPWRQIEALGAAGAVRAAAKAGIVAVAGAGVGAGAGADAGADAGAGAGAGAGADAPAEAGTGAGMGVVATDTEEGGARKSAGTAEGGEGGASGEDEADEGEAGPIARAAMAALAASAAPLTYQPIEGNPIDAEFAVEGGFLCHVGPDAGWPVLKSFLQAASSTLAVAMYDFNADYIAAAFIEAVRGNRLRAELTWDDSMTAPETAIRQQLKAKLGRRLDGAVVRCGGGRRFASAYHEKVAVRDAGKGAGSFWLSSGNWSLRSQPNIDPVGRPADRKGMYARGNREWHVVVEDEALAKLFKRYIEHDLAGSKGDALLVGGAARAGTMTSALDRQEPLRLPDLFVPVDALLASRAALAAAVAEPVAPKTLPSEPRKVKVQPVLTPDNYLHRIRDLLASATRSVYLQYAYISYSDRPEDRPFTELLEQLSALSTRPGMDVRLIVGSNGAADRIRRLAEAGFNEAVFRVQANVHNKGIVVDGKAVLVSSANWSGDGVLRNRDAGLVIHDAEVAGYYEKVFLDDWERRASPVLPDTVPVRIAAEGEAVPAGMVRMGWRDYFG